MDPEEKPAARGGTRRGRFIVFEGLDGSGKSTQIALLAQRLKLLGRRVSCTAEPTSSATGGLLRDALSGCCPRGAAELAGLFLADRITHNQNPVWGIEAALAGGFDVICDRYYYSSFAYQGAETSMDWVMAMNLDCPDILRPDLCVFLDLDQEQCRRRLDLDRAHLEIFEDEQTLKRTREQFFAAFRLLEGRENICVVDAARPPELVADEIYQLVMALERRAGRKDPGAS